MEKIVVVENETKQDYIKKHASRQLVADKILSKHEFIEKFFPQSYYAQAYLLEKYQLDIATIEQQLAIIPYLTAENCITPKLKQLYQIKLELEQHHHLTNPSLFRRFLKNKEVVFYHLSSDSRLDLIRKLSPDTRFIIQGDLKQKPQNIKVTTFNTDIEEITAFFEEVSHHLANGIDINNIKFISRDQNLLNLIHFFKHHYQITIDTPQDLSNAPVTKVFLDTYQKTLDLQAALDEVSDPIFKSQLLTLVNQLILPPQFSQETQFKLIAHKLKNKTTTLRYQQSLKQISIHYPIKDEIVYVLGFNRHQFPALSKEGFLTEAECETIGLNTVSQIKANEVDRINNLLANKNVHFSYSKSLNQQPQEISQVNDSLIEVEYRYRDKLYNFDIHQLRYTYYQDIDQKYHQQISDFARLQNTLVPVYNSYSHQYNGTIKPMSAILSYSTLDSYNKNPFSYYVTKILKLKDNQRRFTVVFGSYLHEVLMRCETADQYFAIKAELIEKYQISIKEQLWIEHLEDQIVFDIQHINEYHRFITPSEILKEQEFVYQLDEKVTLKGFIDKLLIKDNWFMIVDYKKKTSTATTNLKYYVYGIDNQFLTYLYLITKLKPQLRFGGVYYQYLLVKHFEAKTDEALLSWEQEKSKSLKLIGYFPQDEAILNQQDTQQLYLNTKFTKNGKSKERFWVAQGSNEAEHIRLLSDLMKEYETILMNNIQAIMEGQFQINHLFIDGKDMDPYQNDLYPDISFADESDIVERGQEHGLYTGTTTGD